MRVALVLSVLIGCWSPAGAFGQPNPEADLEAIREHVTSARFEQAVSAAEAFLERSDLSAAERNEGLEALAVAQLANRRDDAAEETLGELYRRDPGHRLTNPDASPPVVAAFARARENAPSPVEVTLRHEPPRPSGREPPIVVVRVAQNEDAVAELRLVYELPGEAPARVVMSQRADDAYVARLPVVSDPERTVEVRYRVTALAPSARPLGALGSVDEPLTLRIPPARTDERADDDSARRPAAPPQEPATGGGSVAEEWWFWTLLAVVLVGGGVTAAVLLGPAQEAPDEGTLGSVQLMQLSF